MMTTATTYNSGELRVAGTISQLRQAPLEENSVVDTSRTTSFQPCDLSFLSNAASLHSSDLSTSNIDGPKSIILQGPCHSGRSSLLMEMAVEIASKAPCQCNARRCICLPVALLRPSGKADSFPMRCGRKREDWDMDASDRIQQLKNCNTTGGIPNWNKALLRRIQVHHFASFRDCLQCLLSLQGKPAHEQPYGAIIIDDIDCISDDCLGAKESQMQVAQFLAILFDTVNFLKHRPSICVAINTKSQFPMDCFMASFFESVITIHEKPSDQASWSLACQEHNLVAKSCWTAGVKPITDSKTNEARKHLDYMIAHNGSDDHQTLWRLHSS